MMNRRTFLCGLTLGMLAAPLAVEAQAGKIVRIGFLLGGSATSPGIAIEEFRHVLRDRGWVEGQNITMEYRYADGSYDRLPAFATELVSLPVAVIVAEGSLPALAAKQATQTIPIVMAVAGDPVGSGLVASLSRPGGNITGSSFFFSEITAKRLEMLRDVVPGITRVAVLSNPLNRVHGPALKAIESAARAMRITVQNLQVQTPGDFDSVFSAITRGVGDALIVLEDQLMNAHSRRIADVAAKNRLATIWGLSSIVENGGLMSYAPDRADLWRHAAVLVDRILKGANPADMPVEQARKFDLVINLRTAKALGLKIPQSILLRADKIIE